MSNHLSAETLEKYKARTLPPEELLAAGDHIASCEDCRLQLLSAPERELSRLTQALVNGDDRPDNSANDPDAPNHLDADTFGAYIDGTLNPIDREIADSHLLVCARCREEAEDLRRFRAVLSAYPSVTVGPEGAERESTPQPRRGFGWGIIGVPAFAAAVAIAYVIGANTGKGGEPGTRVARATPSVSGTIPPAPNANRQRIEIALAETARLRAENARLRAALRTHPSPTPEAVIAALPPHPTPAASVSKPESAGATLTTLARASLASLTPAVASALRGGEENGDGGGKGSAGDFGPVSPVGARVLSDRPALRWKPLPPPADSQGAPASTTYIVSIFNAADYTPIVQSPSLAGTQWTPTEALPRGMTYVWRVAAHRGGEDSPEIVAPRGSDPEARFAVLSASEARDLDSALRHVVGSQIARSQVYARYGLFEEARQALDAAAHQWSRD